MKWKASYSVRNDEGKVVLLKPDFLVKDREFLLKGRHFKWHLDLKYPFLKYLSVLVIIVAQGLQLGKTVGAPLPRTLAGRETSSTSES